MEYPGMWVKGDPKTKGSWVPVQTKSGVKFRPAGKGTAKWCKDAKEAIAAQWKRPMIEEGPVKTRFLFLLPRPKTVIRPYPSKARDGDLDKLMRALFDAMTGVVYKDDGQVCSSSEDKRYADAETGVWVYIDTDL
jgi:crossover junction endodeoxyribonuclease RusA